jgi:tRNA (cmo5U34)-methyltransferase
MTLAHAFNTSASRYDRERAALVPHMDLFYAEAVALLDLPRDMPVRVLDLGAGTGLFARLVADAFPLAELTLVDVAAAMLAKAEAHFAAMGRPVTVEVADYAKAPFGGSYDAVISALSIHHLDHADKRRLFGRIRDALVPGGIFVNAEQVLGPSPAQEAAYDAAWLAHARAAGASDETVAAARERMRYDRCATVAEQLAWMTESGLADADCWWKCGRFAVLTGRRPV